MVGIGLGQRGQRDDLDSAWADDQRVAALPADVDDDNRSRGCCRAELRQAGSAEERLVAWEGADRLDHPVPFRGGIHALLGWQCRAAGLPVECRPEHVQALAEVRVIHPEGVSLVAGLQQLRPQDGAALLKQFDGVARMTGGDGRGGGLGGQAAPEGELALLRRPVQAAPRDQRQHGDDRRVPGLGLGGQAGVARGARPVDRADKPAARRCRSQLTALTPCRKRLPEQFRIVTFAGAVRPGLVMQEVAQVREADGPLGVAIGVELEGCPHGAHGLGDVGALSAYAEARVQGGGQVGKPAGQHHVTGRRHGH